MIYVALLRDWMGDILSAKCLLSSSRFGTLLSSPCVQLRSRGFDLLQQHLRTLRKLVCLQAALNLKIRWAISSFFSCVEQKRLYAVNTATATTWTRRCVLNLSRKGPHSIISSWF